MIFEFRPAKRVAETVLLGLVGPSGSGKTYSALLLATGLCAPEARIVVIDTEGHHGRALQYAPPGDNTFDFDHLKLTPPYKAEHYQQAFAAAEKQAGPGGVVIIDSMSAEHESEGGALDEHHRRTGDDASKNMIAWANIRPHQHALCRAITNSSAHVIVCFRAEDKVKLMMVIENGREKTKPVPIGWQAIGWKRWPYEMQVCVLLSHERKGEPIVDGFEWGKIPVNMRGIIPTDRPLTAEVGKRLAAWAAGGDRGEISPDSSDLGASRERAKQIAKAIRDAPNREALQATWQRVAADVSGLPRDGQMWLAERYDLALKQFPNPNESLPEPTAEDRVAVASGDHFGGLEDPGEWAEPPAGQAALPMGGGR